MDREASPQSGSLNSHRASAGGQGLCEVGLETSGEAAEPTASWGCWEKAVSADQEGSSQQTAGLPEPSYWASSLQHCEKPPGLWCSVAAVGADSSDGQ